MWVGPELVRFSRSARGTRLAQTEDWDDSALRLHQHATTRKRVRAIEPHLEEGYQNVDWG